MFLGIDIGNSHIVIGLMNQTEIIRSWRIQTRPFMTSDQYLACLKSLFDLENNLDLNFDNIKTVMISSVVPEAATEWKKAVSQFAVVKEIHHQFPFSFKINVDHPEQVGADRLVNAEASVKYYGAPLIIVDSGTATTLCAVNKNKEYIGGAIIPGMEVAFESLASRASKLFSIELKAPKNVIGRNTEEALRSGVVLGYAELVDGMIRRFKKELGDDSIQVVATGGISQILKNLTKEVNVFDSDLTLKGMQLLHEKISNQ